MVKKDSFFQSANHSKGKSTRVIIREISVQQTDPPQSGKLKAAPQSKREGKRKAVESAEALVLTRVRLKPLEWEAFNKKSTFDLRLDT